MEIHKPKSWHGLREFLKEYLIIVVGVLTALGGEQAVEWLHWRADVAEAREALREELRTNVSIDTIGVEESLCLVDQLDDYLAWTKGGPRPADLAAGFAHFANPVSTVWDTAHGGQTMAHMPLKERLAYARYYAGVANQLGVIQTVRGMATQLARYDGKSELTQDEARRLAEDVSAARVWYRVRAGDDRALIDAARSLGVEPQTLSAETRERLSRLCKRPG